MLCSNSTADNKLLDKTKLKAFSGDKFIAAKMLMFRFDRVENTVGKVENAGHQHFLVFSQYL